MRGLFTFFLISGIALGQAADAPKPADAVENSPPPAAAPTFSQGSQEPSSHAATVGGVDVLSDTRGVDFGPYLHTVLKEVRENWQRSTPESLQNTKRELVIEFSITKDGEVANMKQVSGSGDVRFDRTAWSGIVESAPFPQLPVEFSGQLLALRLHFEYSPRNSGQVQSPPADPNVVTIPAGTKIPLSLAQAISTKNAREGDAVYATTAFPFVMDNRVVIPAGSYIQGSISHVERAGHGRGRSEILLHFTSIIYPSGYTVMLPGSVENTPGADNKSVKDEEGTIQQDKDTGKKVEDAAKNGTYGTLGGATAGGLAGGLNGARVGAGAGAAAGIAWALLKRGPDVKLDVGTSIEMEIQRPVTVDAGRIAVARAGP